MFEYMKLIYYLLSSNTIFIRRNSHGMGDNLLITTVLPIFRQKYPKHKIIVESAWPELFINNPYIDWFTEKHIKTTKKFIRPKYHIAANTDVSIYEQLTAFTGSPVRAQPKLYLSRDEQNEIHRRYKEPYIVVCPIGKTTFTANRKEWGFENFQKLRNLMGDYQFLQIGTPKERLLNNVLDGRNLGIRESAAAIQNGLLFLGLEGGLMHLARSVGQKAVIIYGGFIKPNISGYYENINLYEAVECSPCFHSDYSHSICNSMKCMQNIGPEYVKEKIEEMLIGTFKVNAAKTENKYED